MVLKLRQELLTPDFRKVNTSCIAWEVMTGDSSAAGFL